jgi:hypothetical protein
MKTLRLGYWPNVKNYAAAGDRRRFVFYARERNLSFEVATVTGKFDVVYLTSGCNCSEWIKYKQQYPQTKIIFELIDSYLLEKLNFQNILRGPARFAKGKEKAFYLDYRKAFIKMISVADAVVCSTEPQKDYISRYNSNVHISLDYFTDDINFHKTDFSASSKLKLVWEGQAYTVQNLFAINDALRELRDEIELTIVTDPVIKYPLRIFDRRTTNLLRGIKCNFTVESWEKNSFSRYIARCDLSIIPIDRNHHLMWNKPENKLLLLWEIGIPVLTSPTPAYKRVMDQAGVDGLCRSTDEWINKIRDFKSKSNQDKNEMARLGRNYIELRHSKRVILQTWDNIFASVLPAMSMTGNFTS